jgi:hypothetical protein
MGESSGFLPPALNIPNEPKKTNLRSTISGDMWKKKALPKKVTDDDRNEIQKALQGL